MQLKRSFIVAGTLQGLGLWWLWHAKDNEIWPSTDPIVFFGLLWPMLAVPLALYWTEAIRGLSQKNRIRILIGVAVLYGGLGAFEAWSSGMNLSHPSRGFISVGNALAATILLFVGVHLLSGRDGSRKGWHYTDLFEYAWRNGVLSVTATMMLGAFWTILFAGAMLLKLVDVDWVYNTLQKSWFVYPASGAILASAYGLGMQRAGITSTIRKFWLSIMAWLFPLVMVFAVAWSVLMPVMGLDKLFKTGSAAFMMLWFAALAIKFVNCAYQDGIQDTPYPKWLNQATKWAWVALLPVVLVALWALGLRIAQHGWSVDRIWGFFVAVMVSAYVLGYLWSWRVHGRWMGAIGQTNVVVAIAMCVGIVLLISPLADARRLAFMSQMARYDFGPQKTFIQPDWRFLSRDSGRYGQQQLQKWASGEGLPPGHAWIAQAKDAYSNERNKDVVVKASSASVPKHLPVHPKGKNLPADFVAHVLDAKNDWRWNRCLQVGAVCPVWIGDLDSDGQDELVVFAPDAGPRRTSVEGHVYAFEGNKWIPVGTMRGEGHVPISDDSLSLKLDSAHTQASGRKDLLIGEHRLFWSR